MCVLDVMSGMAQSRMHTRLTDDIRLNVALLAMLAMLLLPARSGHADDWPQWRGPNRDGVYHETGLLETFPAEGLKVGWRVAVGWGFSSPVVAQGRVFVSDAQLEDPHVREQVHCFDEATGKSLWTWSQELVYPDWVFTPGQEQG